MAQSHPEMRLYCTTALPSSFFLALSLFLMKITLLCPIFLGRMSFDHNGVTPTLLTSRDPFLAWSYSVTVSRMHVKNAGVTFLSD